MENSRSTNNKVVNSKPKKRTKKKSKNPKIVVPSYPRHNLESCLRLPKAIFDQNAGKLTKDDEVAKYIGRSLSGPVRMEISSCSKYGLLEKPEARHLKPTELAKSILRPQDPSDKRAALHKAILKAPLISDVYKHYRGELIPDAEFFHNALIDKFKLPKDKVVEFKTVFIESLKFAELLKDENEKITVIDIVDHTHKIAFQQVDKVVRKDTGGMKKVEGKKCFVMMPFTDPIGGYYQSVFKPAIEKVGMIPVRADNDIFGTGKIVEQIWDGIQSATVLVAELSSRNPNVYYELGLAHALKKPVVLVSSKDEDVPFDLQHVRVIYYDYKDPFWGEKLINKLAENIAATFTNPVDAILFK
ncbi:MAG: hypothetical protein AAF806_26310 [Bacteroidota bacterium]